MDETINVLIVDDEKLTLDLIRRMIEKHCPALTVKGEAKSADEARKILKSTEIDAIFLDITMPEEDGFQLLESIDSSKYMFVFVTASDQYALRALRASAVDYIQKPIDVTELKHAAGKLTAERHKYLHGKKPEAHNLTVESLISNSTQKKGINRLCLPDMHGFVIVEVKDIMYLDAESNYTVFHLSNQKKIVVSKPIKDYEEVLDPNSFFRIHKSSIVNLKHLTKFSKVDGYYAIMADNCSISVSRRRLPDFMKAVVDFNSTEMAA